MKLGSSLNDARRIYVDKVRKHAAKARSAVSTPGKEATYAEKLRQAETYFATGTVGPYIEAQARRGGVSVEDAACEIKEASVESARRLCDIDDAELTAIRQIKDAGSISEAKSVLDRYLNQ